MQCYVFANTEQPPRDKEADTKIKDALLANKIAEAVALGEGLAETFFDYGEVQAGNRAELQTLTGQIKRAIGGHLKAIVEIGEGLLKAKELLGHGNFLPWLAAEFRWSERTAQSYMTLAEHFQGKTAKFADLDLGTARSLIKAPTEVRDEIFARAEAGEIIRKDEVKAKLAERPAATAHGVGVVRLHAQNEDRQVGTLPKSDYVPRVDRISPITDRRVEDIDIRHSAADILNSLLRIERQMDRCDVDDLIETLLDERNKQCLPDIRKVLGILARFKQGLDLAAPQKPALRPVS
jgi:Protein of unknown function (DUF3102)